MLRADLFLLAIFNKILTIFTQYIIILIGFRSFYIENDPERRKI